MTDQSKQLERGYTAAVRRAESMPLGTLVTEERCLRLKLMLTPEETQAWTAARLTLRKFGLNLPAAWQK